jgi:DHA1 family multidrug resistance protein-like MFS transporter
LKEKVDPQTKEKTDDISWKKNLWIMFVAQVTVMIGFSSVFPFLPVYVESIGKVSFLSIELLMGLVFQPRPLP